ncbi:helix-turn-helix domain-containing protein [Actinocorallia longicatena]|uniref:HTH araC/xylS-type domain-containing protein n=1 Tax=Actinocorallia longicatena TaxID=111803 RepID=A0ABP6QDQ7_9ACTN
MKEARATETTETECVGIDAVEDFLSTSYGTSVRIRHRDGRADLRARRTSAGTFSLDAFRQTVDLSLDVEPLNAVVVSMPTDARVDRRSSDGEGRYGPGDVLLVANPDRPYRVRCLPGGLVNITLDRSVLDQVAEGAPARRPAPIRFTGLDPVSPAAAAHWRSTRLYLAGLLDDPEAASSPLLLAGAAQLLAATTLATFPSTALTVPTIEDRHDASPITLRRAVAFIEANAATAVSVADIAAAARVSVRAVQLVFRRHLDTTPTAYLRRVRLDQVHQALLAADPAATTVAAIAAAWGFGHGGRFTDAYRAAFGTLPAAALRR